MTYCWDFMCVLHMHSKLSIVLLFSLLRSDFLCSGLCVMFAFVVTVKKFVQLNVYIYRGRK
jgi:hypothetical protein